MPRVTLHISCKVNRSKVKVTRRISAVIENQPHLKSPLAGWHIVAVVLQAAAGLERPRFFLTKTFLGIFFSQKVFFWVLGIF